MFSVRVRSTTYLCLKGDPYTGYCTGLSRAAICNSSPVLCSVPSSQTQFTTPVDWSHGPFHLPICAAGGRRHGGYCANHLPRPPAGENEGVQGAKPLGGVQGQSPWFPLAKPGCFRFFSTIYNSPRLLYTAISAMPKGGRLCLRKPRHLRRARIMTRGLRG